MTPYSNFVIDKKEYENKNTKSSENNFDVFSKASDKFTFGAKQERYEVKKTNFKAGFYVRKPN